MTARSLTLLALPLLLAGCVVVADKSDGIDPVDSADSGSGDSGGADCQAAVAVSNGGAAIAGDYALRIEVSPFNGAADDLSNVGVLDASGAPLPRWVESASGGAGVLYATVTDLPAGDSTLTLDACGSSSLPNEASEVFAFSETFSGGLGSNTIGCERVVSDGSGGYTSDEACEYSYAEESGDGFLSADVFASCYADPYDGAAVAITGSAELVAGDYQLSAYVRTQGSLYDFCSGTGKLNVVGNLNGSEVLRDECLMTDCGECATPDWRAVAGDVVTASAGVQDVYLRLQAGDCSEGVLDLSELRLERVVDPAPVATQSAR